MLAKSSLGKKVNITFPVLFTVLRYCFISIITLVEYHILSVSILFFIASTNLVYYNRLVISHNSIHIKY